MSQLAASEGQPRFSGGGAGLFLRRRETVRSQEECWQERYDGRLSRTDLWGRGGEIPLRYPTCATSALFHKVCATAQKMRAGPSEPAYRSRLQTT